MGIEGSGATNNKGPEMDRRSFLKGAAAAGAAAAIGGGGT